MPESDDLNGQTVAYQGICSDLGYSTGLIEEVGQARTSTQKHLFEEAKRLIGNIDALYFSGDVPIAYFRLLSQFNKEEIIKLHRRIWNQNRVPLLYVVTPNELKIYNCFERPANPEEEDLDTQKRRIVQINLATDILEELKDFSKDQIDSGAFWKSEKGQYFRSDRRVDYNLLRNLRITRKKMLNQGLDYSTVHNLLGRSIFILYLEDRGAIDRQNYYSRFVDGATTYFDILKNRDATYRLFETLEEKFNGDLFPVTESEQNDVEENHLRFIRELFFGTQMDTGQRPLWRCYDFGVIPIELISAIYEEFLHTEEGRGYVSKKGTYYTPHTLVEFIMNEVLPWPDETNCQYNLKILDPACGSGIFLVEAFRRLVVRWMFEHNMKNIPKDELILLLTDRIYGADINLDSIKVAAFSLYLALLDYLEPRTIWEEFRFPYLIFKQDSPNQSGKNLFQKDTFGENIQFERSDYDIVVGNPPWKRDGLPENVSEYLRERNFGQEFAQAFLWRARDFTSTSNGIIALLATSKILFNLENPDCNFREKFFGENYVETVVNFSSLRRTKSKMGRQLFVSSVGPATVFFYRRRPPENPKATILYCTPKPTKMDNAIPGIQIDPSEFKFLPREKCCSSDKIWKVAMWGTQRDLEIIEKFQQYPTLAKHFEACKSRSQWKKARGFQTSPNPSKNKLNERLAKMPFIDAEDVTRFWINPERISTVEPNTFAAFGCMETYSGPHILIKAGQAKKRFCATFTEHDCAFRATITGISGPPDDLNLMKAITAYLNSSFSTYFLFMTASNWSVEREIVYTTEVFQLPDLPFQFTNDVIEELASKVDAISKLMSEGVSENNLRILEIENNIDQIIFANLDLSDSERFLIDDVLQYSLDFFQEGEQSKACDIVQPEDLQIYAETFTKEMNSILQFGETRAIAKLYRSDSPLRLVSFIFTENQEESPVQWVESSNTLNTSLARIEEQILSEHSRNIYVRRNIKFYDRYALHILKSDEKRFWSRSIAFRDADETLAEGLILED